MNTFEVIVEGPYLQGFKPYRTCSKLSSAEKAAKDASKLFDHADQTVRIVDTKELRDSRSFPLRRVYVDVYGVALKTA